MCIRLSDQGGYRLSDAGSKLRHLARGMKLAGQILRQLTFFSCHIPYNDYDTFICLKSRKLPGVVFEISYEMSYFAGVNMRH